MLALKIKMKFYRKIIIISIFVLSYFTVLHAFARIVYDTPQIQEDYEIEAECKQLFPNLIWDYLNRRDCVNQKKEAAEAKKKEAQLEAAKRLREDNARACIADEIPRLEDALRKVKSTLRELYNQKIEDLTINKAQEVIQGLDNSYKIDVGIPDDNFREKVLVFTVKPHCDSDFHYLINLRFDQTGLIRWFKVWSRVRPRGSDEFIMNIADNALGDNYEAERLSAEAAKIDEQIKKQKQNEQLQKEKIENERIKNQQHQMIISNLVQGEKPGYINISDQLCYVWDPHPIPGESVTWDGSCSNELADGPGELTWFYSGKWQALKGILKEGQIQDGQVQQRLSINDYTSYGIVVDRKFEGHVISKKSNGFTVFDGNYEKGRRKGFGVYYWDNDVRYEGFWSDGYAEGKGLLIIRNSSRREVWAKKSCIWASILSSNARDLLATIEKPETQCILEN